MEVKLVYFRSDGQRREVMLEDGVTPVGRRDDCDLRIPAETVSRRHCQFEVGPAEVVLIDLGSSNGTFVNANKIVDEDVVLKPGDQIRIGPATFTIQIDGEPAELEAPIGAAEPDKKMDDSTLSDDSFDPFGALEELIDDLEDGQDAPSKSGSPASGAP